MNIYKAYSVSDYMYALRDIAEYRKHGLIECYTDEDTLKGCLGPKTYFHTAVDLGKDIFLMFSGSAYLSVSDLGDNETDANMECFPRLLPSGVIADGRIYKDGTNLFPCHMKIRTVDMDAETEEVTERASKYLVERYSAKYPSLDDIPEKYRETDVDDIRRRVRERIIRGKENRGLCWKINFKDVFPNAVHTLIMYNRAKNDGRADAFIKEKVEAYLAEPYFVSEPSRGTNDEFYLRRLAYHYAMEAEMENAKKETHPEDAIFMEIRKRVETFVNDNKSVRRIRIVVNGRDGQVPSYIKNRHGGADGGDCAFTVEGEPLEYVCEPNAFLGKYGNNGRAFDMHWYAPDNPRIKEPMSNRNEAYQEAVAPSDVSEIRFGRQVIYKK